MPVVLVTRPREDSERLAQSLSAAGYTPWIEPLLTIQVNEAPRPIAGGVRAVMLTSHHALTGLLPRREGIKDLLRKPCYCVGARTGQDARVFGFHDVIVADGDGRALAAKIRDTLPLAGGGTILHPCGMDTAPNAVRILRAIGFKVQPWAIYKAEATQALSPQIIESLRAGQLAAALFFSPRTAEIFCQLIQSDGLSSCCNSLTAIGLSEAVSAVLGAVPFRGVYVASSADEAAMIATLRGLIPSATK